LRKLSNLSEMKLPGYSLRASFGSAIIICLFWNLHRGGEFSGATSDLPISSLLLILIFYMYQFILAFYDIQKTSHPGERGRREKPLWVEWTYRHRWNRVFVWWVFPLILFQLPLAWWFYNWIIDFDSTKIEKTVNLFNFLAMASLWPLFLFLWFIKDRDKNKEFMLSLMCKLERDFGELKEQAGSGGKGTPSQIASLFQLKRFLSGEVVDQRDPQENAFQRPTIELFKALLSADSKKGMKPSLYKVLKNVFQRDYPLALVKSNLQEIYLPEADMVGTNLSNSNLQDACLRGSFLTNTNLSDCLLDNVNFCNAHISNAKLNKSSLKKANLQNACLINSNFSDCILDGANFCGADLSGCKLNNSSLRDIGWDSILSIEGAQIVNVLNPPQGFTEWALKNGATDKM